jgi:hypothetical protein
MQHRAQNIFELFGEQISFFDFDILETKFFTFVALKNIVAFEFVDRKEQIQQ